MVCNSKTVQKRFFILVNFLPLDINFLILFLLNFDGANVNIYLFMLHLLKNDILFQCAICFVAMKYHASGWKKYLSFLRIKSYFRSFFPTWLLTYWYCLHNHKILTFSFPTVIFPLRTSPTVEPNDLHIWYNSKPCRVNPCNYFLNFCRLWWDKENA